MTAIQYTPKAIDDILRLVLFVLETEPAYAEQVTDVIESGILVLQHHPYIGRFLRQEDAGELIISQGKSGYTALCKYEVFRDIVTILAIRHQREVDYH